MRALAWPGLLSALALLGTTSIVALLVRSPEIAVPPGAEVVAARLEQAGFAVQLELDPEAAVAEGRVARAAWPVDGGWAVLGGSWPGLALRAEGAVRDAIGAPWTVELPPPRARSPSSSLAMAVLAALVSVLFALYGVVLGAGLVWRDSREGVLEAEHSLPVPAALHGLARLLAASVVLSAALGATVLLLHALVGVPDAGAWSWHGSLAGAAGVGLGLSGMGGRGEGFSGRLSRALTATLALVALGWSLPAVGAWLPVASVPALLRGQGGLAEGAVATLSAVLLGGIAVWRAGRRGIA